MSFKEVNFESELKYLCLRIPSFILQIIKEINSLYIFLYIYACLASPASILFGISPIGLALGDGCRVGWANDIRRRYLTFIFLVQNLAVLQDLKKKRQRVRPLVMTIRSSAPISGRGETYISSLTWASCVAYLSDRLAKACTKDKQQ